MSGISWNRKSAPLSNFRFEEIRVCKRDLLKNTKKRLKRLSVQLALQQIKMTNFIKFIIYKAQVFLKKAKKFETISHMI